MHYYQHHIGDYRRDTAHLSLLEHGVYRQLLDWAYLDNEPIPKETETVYRRLSARTQDEKNAVDIVLSEFFTLEIGYTQKRAEIEKQAYERKAATARIAGKLGGRPKKTEEVISGLTELTDSKANHEPLTINHKPKEEGRRATRIPTNFEPTPEPEAEAGIDRQKELANFRDYWAAKAGKDAAKLDWQATWRQWARKADRPGISRFAKPAPNITVPSRQERDPELTRLDIERSRSVPMPQNIREQMQKLKFGAHA
jgi:uncharacterized protein YdaU (DUF1376 family)